MVFLWNVLNYLYLKEEHKIDLVSRNQKALEQNKMSIFVSLMGMITFF